MEKFQGKYRIPSARWKDWDYGSVGAYFITICTKDRHPYFGEIMDGKMIYTPLGAIADVLWMEIKNHTRNIELGEFVVMPNHLHGILIVETLHATSPRQTLHATSLPNRQMAAISPKPGTIPAIIRSYKSAVTRHAHRLQMEFAWQPRFYDRIIRDNRSHSAIAEYIRRNPLNWEKDKLHERQ